MTTQKSRLARKRNYYVPDVSVKFSPRVDRRLRTLVNRLCRSNEMTGAEVLRYVFEAGALSVHARKMQLIKSTSAAPLDSMVTVLTSRKIAAMVREIHERNQTRKGDVHHADILRWLLGTVLTWCEQRGLAHVLTLREQRLRELRA